MLRVAFGLLLHGIEVHAAFPRAEGTASMAADCAAARVPCRPFDCDARTVASRCRQVRRLLEEVRPDVVQITAGWPTQAIEPALGCALESVPMLAVFQLAPEPVALPQYCLKRLDWARSRRQRWMAVSQQNLLHLQKTFATRKEEIGVLPNGIDIRPGHREGPQREVLRRDVRSELGVPDDARLVLTTGRLDQQKGHSDLLKIVPEVIHRFPEVRFVWAGDGTERQRLDQKSNSTTCRSMSVCSGIAPISLACSMLRTSSSFLLISRADARRPFVKRWCTRFRSSPPTPAASRRS